MTENSLRPQKSDSSLRSGLWAGWREWGGLLPPLVGAGTLAGGWLTNGDRLAPLGLFILLLLLVAGLYHLWRSQAGERPPGLAAELEGALLLLVSAWIVYRLGVGMLPVLVLVPAAVLAWIAGRHTGPVALVAVLIALGLEAGPVAKAGEPYLPAGLNLIFFLLLALGARYYPGSRLYREQLRARLVNQRHEEQGREQAREFGLDGGTPLLADGLQALEVSTDPTGFSRQALAQVSASFELELEMLRQALELTTVAILWPSPDGSELRLRYLATVRTDIDRGPYPAGSGITGALNRREEVELAPVASSYPALPYYREHRGGGAVLALRIPEELESSPPPAVARRSGILCVDREAGEPWSERDRQVLRLAARKLGLEVAGSRQLLNLDRERAAIHQLSLSLRELNSGLTLESVFVATGKALKAQAPLDLVALSLLEGEEHRLILADGGNLDELIGQSFPHTAGLVGQAIRTGSVLPAGGRYPKPAPIFSADRLFSEYNSLLVFPLRNEQGEALGALVAAARAAGIFTRSRREMLELITTQVAIKIELAQAHDQLSRLATTDGLTGLANHRSFQHGFEIMLERARRNRTPLCLLLGDLDHFKQVNDTYGHPFGDLVLQLAAQVMAETVRTIDLAARYGGEEFAMVLENCDATGGHQLAERVREKIAQLRPVCQGVPVSISMSLGLAVFPEDGGARDLLIRKADQALYRAKDRGRNRTVIWLASDD